MQKFLRTSLKDISPGSDSPALPEETETELLSRKNKRSEETIMNQFEMKQSAYQSQLKSRALQVLLYLIDRSDKEQTCFPAVPTISRELHISISTVKRAMRELVEAGYVAKESRFREGNRGQTSNLYILHFPEKEKEPEQVETVQESIRLTETETTGQGDAAPVCADAESAGTEDREQGMDEMENVSVENTVENRADQEILCLCVRVAGGGGQSDTALNFQSNQRLKSGKIVFIGGSGVSAGSFPQKSRQCPHGRFLPVQAVLPP